MDDFVFILNKKEEAKIILTKIEKYFPVKLGIDFCGYRVYENHILIRNRNKKKIIKEIKSGKNIKNYKGYLIHSNSHNFYTKYK